MLPYYLILKLIDLLWHDVVVIRIVCFEALHILGGNNVSVFIAFASNVCNAFEGFVAIHGGKHAVFELLIAFQDVGTACAGVS
jgi:hypothetical protein